MKDDHSTTERAFWTLGEDRPSRWLITCDHATNRVPRWVGGGELGIADADMGRHELSARLRPGRYTLAILSAAPRLPGVG